MRLAYREDAPQPFSELHADLAQQVPSLINRVHWQEPMRSRP
jgi:hypothetical protein